MTTHGLSSQGEQHQRNGQQSPQRIATLLSSLTACILVSSRAPACRSREITAV